MSEKETYLLEVPTKEHFKLEFEVKLFTKEDGSKWIKMSAIANNTKILSWYEWIRSEKWL